MEANFKANFKRTGMKADRFFLQRLSLFLDDLHKSTAGALTRWRVCPIAKVERGRRAGQPAASPAREEHVKEHKDVKWLQKSESDTRPLRMPQHWGACGEREPLICAPAHSVSSLRRLCHRPGVKSNRPPVWPALSGVWAGSVCSGVAFGA